MNMSVRHVLVPQARYDSLISIEQRYLISQTKTSEEKFKSSNLEKDSCLQQQKEEVVEEEGEEEQKQKFLSSSSSLSKEWELESVFSTPEDSKTTDQSAPCDMELEGQGPVGNIQEEQFLLLHPPGIPAGRRTIKKWLVWH